MSASRHSRPRGPDDRRRRGRPDTGDLPPIRKSLGQHFLNDARALGRILDALQLTGEDTVVEIGPGRGALTERLVHRAKRLVLIEYDRKLAAILRVRYETVPSVEVVEADVLQTDLGSVARGPYILVGNVPYYIVTPILFHALVPPRPERAVYLVQREVAERLVANPGSKTYGALSVNVQAVAAVESIARVPPGAFHPPPRVESAIVRVTPRRDPVVSAAEEGAFRAMVQAAFGMRRKQMRRVLRSIAAIDVERADAILGAAGIVPTARPETLSPSEFATLLRHLRPADAASPAWLPADAPGFDPLI